MRWVGHVVRMGGEERGIQGFGGENWGADGKVILINMNINIKMGFKEVELVGHSLD